MFKVLSSILDILSLTKLKFLYFLVSFYVLNCHVSSSSSYNNHEIDPHIHWHHKKHYNHFNWVTKEKNQSMMNSVLLFWKIKLFKFSKASGKETGNKCEYTSKDESRSGLWFPSWFMSDNYEEKIHWQLVVQSKVILIIIWLKLNGKCFG